MSTSKTVKGLTIQIGGDTSNLGKELKEVDSEISSLTKSLKTVNSLLEFDTSNTDLVKNKQQLLAIAIEDTEDRLETLKKAQEEFTPEQIEENQTAYVELQTEILETESKLSDLKNEASNWNKVGTALSNIGDKITSLGTTLTTSLTLPVISLATYVTTTAIEFESAFTGVTKTVEGTDEQLEELKQGIMDLAEECPATTTEISEVAEAAGQLGIATEDVLDFTKVMIDLGESTNMEATEAAESLAKFANITGLAADEYSNLGSAIVDLGNNFATTEDDIVTMATRMASAGTIAGLTEQEILALATSISSVGIEAEAGGSAMSTTLTTLEKAVASGGESLEQFAEIAGMSSKEFANAWENEPMVALQAFISGLGNLDDESESTALILEDLGLSSIRQSNMLRALALSADDLADAVNTSNTAWDENTALTEEANKRYETTESQIAMAKSKLDNIAITLGSELLPYVNKALEVISDLAEEFANLTDEEQKDIIKTAAMVAAIGPLVTIAGKAITGIGTLTTTIGLLKNEIGTATGTAANLANGIKTLTSTTSLLTIGVGLATTAFLYFTTRQTEAQEAANSLKDEISDAKDTMEEYNEAIDEQLEADLSEIEYVEKLKDELSDYVDENGNVIAGYESRVDFILNELNDALGTEYALNDNLITKNGELVESYQDIENEMDNLFAQKKAEIILSAQEELYEEAIQNQTEAVELAQEALDQLGGSYDEAVEKSAAWHEAQTAAMAGNTELVEEIVKEYGDFTTAELDALDTSIAAYEEATEMVKTYTEEVQQYEENYALFSEGKYDEIANSIITTTEECAETTTETVATAISAQKDLYDEYAEIAETTGNEVAATNAETAKNNVISLIDSLVERTSQLDTLGEEEAQAWKDVAETDVEAYRTGLSKLSEETREEVERITGVFMTDEEAQESATWIANKITEMFSGGLTLKDTVSDELDDVAITVSENAGTILEEVEDTGTTINLTLVERLREAVETYKSATTEVETIAEENTNEVSDIYDESSSETEKTMEERLKEAIEIFKNAKTEVEEVAQENADEISEIYDETSEDSYTWGSDLVTNFGNGITSNSKYAVDAASLMASQISGILGFSEPEKGPLSDFHTYAPDMIALFTEGIEENKSKLIASVENMASDMKKIINTDIVDYGNIQNTITEKIIDSTKMVFTTPQITFNVQEMNKENLETCFNYINRKFGSKY